MAEDCYFDLWKEHLKLTRCVKKSYPNDILVDGSIISIAWIIFGIRTCTPCKSILNMSVMFNNISPNTWPALVLKIKNKIELTKPNFSWYSSSIYSIFHWSCEIEQKVKTNKITSP